ncbi:hypothetical protein McanMca71_007056 [Microsporum canis]|uniref:Up-regulated in Daf-2 domain-containing protein n=1 Tax=Arthroderma otae (strain ATCC MYA-4605 / CBS 113480) TaxID=554155 RepID=C5FNP8_ARTOC|nr:uncharacterized protein MCYG_04570 [Microsporum canis CBS 113480]EEQ31751.1 predicted protein [Microsporum canis CBS 113480]
MLAFFSSAMATVSSLVTGQVGNNKTARVTVVNDTTRPIVAISVIHKFSNTHKSRQEWSMVQPGKNSTPELQVEYPAGSGVTGDNLWLVIWYSEDLQALQHSEPSESVFPRDVLDRQTREEIQRVKEALATGSEPGSKGAQLASALAKATTDRIFNSKSAEGFAQHALREEDANELTEIVINANDTITFKSKSGSTEVKFSSQPATAETASYREAVISI